MATRVVDITPLAEAEVVAEPVVSTPAEVTLETQVEPEGEPKVEAKETPEVKGEPKADLVPRKPEALARNINSTLQKFFSEAKPTAEGRELLQKINKEVGSLYSQVAEAKAAAKDVEAVTTSAKELSDLVSESDALVYAGDPQIVQNIY